MVFKYTFIGVILVFLFLLIVFKIARLDRKFNIVLGSAIAATLLSPIVFFTIFFTPIAYYYPKRTFNPTKWHQNIDKRYRMSEDLINSEVLIGLTKEEVIKLLGDDYENNTKNEILYFLGTKPGMFPIDPDGLKIKFKDGKVYSVTQFTS